MKNNKGAHFYKCDFQIHSPRDLNWKGKKFGYPSEETKSLTEEENNALVEQRNSFAKDYLQKIRDKGLHAVAITDHHDVVFAKLIRRLAEDENKLFLEQGQAEKCITVFPGIEVSLSNPPCQCLLIFDANFEDKDLDHTLIALLGVQPTSEYHLSTAETKKISADLIKELNDFHRKLDEISCAKGKYIILPNVNNGGDYTLLRTGMHEHYAKMLCVGGYTDGDKKNKKEDGYNNIIDGRTKDYGNKSIGVISTSDNRKETGEDLGKGATWIKYSQPTAEALRQACIAKRTRLSQTQPELPETFIARMEVTKSKFLGAFSIDFNQQYNALIGGRGTGKSTILEYLRWGLCDTLNLEDGNRSSSLIEKTLKSVKGEVIITVIINKTIHIVKRNSETGQLLLKIADKEYEPVKEEQVRNLLRIHAYSQKQLSNVAVKSEELKRFIELPIKTKLDVLNSQLKQNLEETTNAYRKMAKNRELLDQIGHITQTIKSLTSQSDALQKYLTGISDVDQKIMSEKQKHDREKSLIDELKSSKHRFTDKINGLIEELNNRLIPDSKQSFEDNTLVKGIHDEYMLWFEQARDRLSSLIEVTEPSIVHNNIAQWEGRRQDVENQYRDVTGRINTNRAQMDEIQEIESRLKTLLSDETEKRSILQTLASPEIEFANLRQDYSSILEHKFNLLNGELQKFSKMSKDIIQAELSRKFRIDRLKENFTLALKGSRIQEDTINSFFENIINTVNPLQTLLEVFDELRLLVEKNFGNVSALIQNGFTEDHLKKIAEKLDSEKWLDLIKTDIEYIPEFCYVTNKRSGDKIPFSDASAGQQATALLTVLLNQPGIPLIIDQPEDDIDNRAIEGIIENVWESKKKRQLIFTSHNANLVVNGDAELVICYDYSESDNQAQGTVKAEGSIDSKSVRDEITSVMEGGEKAFRLRKDKYGY